MHGVAHAKVNWSLAIYDRLPNGYHEIDTIMQKISLFDDVSLEPTRGRTFVKVSGLDAGEIPVDERNLACRAAMAYAQHARLAQSWCITLHKRTPACAGLGGGSADAASVLGLLEQQYRALGEAALMRLAGTLGADVPFALHSARAARCRGLGEQVEPLKAKSMPLLLVMGKAGISTARAYQSATVRKKGSVAAAEAQRRLASAARALAVGDVQGMETACFNDLLPSASSMCPEVRDILLDLRTEGATVTAMTGSGSACFGAFFSEEEARRAFQKLRDTYAFVAMAHTLSGEAAGAGV